MIYQLHNILFFEILSKEMMWAVPVFFMITGSLLLVKENINYYEVIKKYVLRIIFAISIFGIPMAIISEYFESGSINLCRALVIIIKGESWNHLWYLYTLLGVYLLLPVFSTFLHNTPEKEHLILSINIFIFTFIIQILENIYSIDIAFTIDISWAFFYLIVGYMISVDYKDSIQYIKTNWLILILFFLAFAIAILVVVLPVEFAPIIGKYYSPVISCEAALIFLLFRKTFLVRENTFSGGGAATNC
ncbi:MAG: acyltransferase [Clostridia bacterium]|nr:acyltransferase [Clostridia bacterium]